MAVEETFYGAAITFSSGFFGEITGARWTGWSRAAIPTSHTGLTAKANNRASATFVPGDIVDPGELEVDINFDKDTEPPMYADAETVTVTFDQETDEATSPATWAASGFLTSFSFDSNGAGEDGIISATGTIKFSGNITVTAAV